MKWYERFEHKHRRFGVPNLMMYISISMVVIALAEIVFGMPIYAMLNFNLELILKGQVWRLVTFALLPASRSPFWIALIAYTYYLLGRDLELNWGTAVFNLYYLIGLVGTVIAGCIVGYADSTYLNLSIFLAYAFLFPNSVFRVYFLLPIKAKYLAYFSGAIYVLSLALSLYSGITMGDWSRFFMLVASLINFMVFFFPEIIGNIRRRIKSSQRKKEYERNLRKGRDE